MCVWVLKIVKEKTCDSFSFEELEPCICVRVKGQWGTVFITDLPLN